MCRDQTDFVCVRVLESMNAGLGIRIRIVWLIGIRVSAYILNRVSAYACLTRSYSRTRSPARARSTRIACTCACTHAHNTHGHAHAHRIPRPLDRGASTNTEPERVGAQRRLLRRARVRACLCHGHVKHSRLLLEEQVRSEEPSRACTDDDRLLLVARHAQRAHTARCAAQRTGATAPRLQGRKALLHGRSVRPQRVCGLATRWGHEGGYALERETEPCACPREHRRSETRQ